MYPTGDLSELAIRKAHLRRRIARSREVCVESATEVVEPLERLNRLHAQWRQIAPLVKLAAIPAGFLLTRKLRRGGSLLSTAVKWLPIAFKVFQSVRSSKTGKPAASGTAPGRTSAE